MSKSLLPNQALQTDVFLADARNHAAERQVVSRTMSSAEDKKGYWKPLICVGILALINFGTFLVMAVKLGGDAINGKQEGGLYYLSSHGQLTEVSARVYWYSFCHSISVVFTHVAALFVAFRLFISSRHGPTDEGAG